MELGGLWRTNVLNSGLPTHRHRPDTWLEHQEPVSCAAQNKWEKKRKKGREKERKKERKKGSKEGKRKKERKEGRRKEARKNKRK